MTQALRNTLIVLALVVPVGLLGTSLAPAQVKDKKDAKTAVFEVYKDTGGDFRFRLKDEEEVILCTSGKGYKTKADCQKVIDAIKSNAPKAKVDDQAK